jgi:hypothetical protein
MFETVRLSPGRDGRLRLGLTVTARCSEADQEATGDCLTLSLGLTTTGESPLAAGDAARIGRYPLEVRVISQQDHVIRAVIRAELVLNAVAGADLRTYAITGSSASCAIASDDGTNMPAHAELQPAGYQAGAGMDDGLEDGTKTPVSDAMPPTIRRRMPRIRSVDAASVARAASSAMAPLRAWPRALATRRRRVSALVGAIPFGLLFVLLTFTTQYTRHDTVLPPTDRRLPKPHVARASSLVTSTVAPQSGLLLNPNEVDFGHQAMNITSDLHTVRLMNLGPTPLPIARLAISGVEASAFSEVNACAGTVVDVDAGCVIRVSFTPTTRGTHSARLVITDTAGHRHDLVLRGYS